MRQTFLDFKKTANMASNDSSDEIHQAASKLEHARANNYQVGLLSKTMPDLDQRKGYKISAAVKALREDTQNDKVIGRKIGFSNRNIWPEYGIDSSNWSYVYDKGFSEIPAGSQEKRAVEVDIRHFSRLEPRIEPEIILGIAGDMTSEMSEAQILQRIQWIAHGFEIVVSIFPDWKFTAADTTAAFALHGQLLCGPKISVQDLDGENSQQLLDQLANFTISLKQNGEVADEGKGSNVLGSPIKALRHLLDLLEQDEPSKRLSPGEVVTTGTLTRALPINDGDVWSTELSGINLPGLRVKFNLS